MKSSSAFYVFVSYCGNVAKATCHGTMDSKQTVNDLRRIAVFHFRDSPGRESFHISLGRVDYIGDKEARSLVQLFHSDTRLHLISIKSMNPDVWNVLLANGLKESHSRIIVTEQYALN